jgi:hypothetical protein
MAYQSPSVTSSGTTFAQLRSGGLRGQLDRLATSNAFSPAVRSLIVGPLDTIHTGIVHAVDAFIQGDPVATGDVSAKLLTYATALKAIACALDEVNALIDANTGTLKNIVGAVGSGIQRRRSFP